MKVFYITMQFPYPSETFATNDVLSLHRQGVDVSVHSLRTAHKDVEGMVKDRGLQAIPLTHNSFWMSLRGAFWGLRHPRKLAELTTWNVRNNKRKRSDLLKGFLLFPRVFGVFDTICRAKPDVVHLFWGHYPSLVAHLVQQYLPTIKVTTFLGAYDLAMQYGGGEEVARKADVVWTHVRENVGDIKTIGVSPERIKVVYRGADLTKMKTAHNRVRRRIVVVGRLQHHKGAEAALAVFGRVFSEYSDATLFVLGDGPERERLENLAQASGVGRAVTFLGHVSHDQVLEELAVAEVFLHMSEVDWLPNALKEAMASGCVCVATATTGMSELMPDGEAGFVVPIGDVEQAAARVTEIFSGEVDTSALVRNAKQHVQRYFDLDTSMSEYKKTWASLSK